MRLKYPVVDLRQGIASRHVPCHHPFMQLLVPTLQDIGIPLNFVILQQNLQISEYQIYAVEKWYIFICFSVVFTLYSRYKDRSTQQASHRTHRIHR